VVEGKELGRRIKAARLLRDVSQRDLATVLATEGFGKHDLGAIERGTKTLQGAIRRELALRLRVPEQWFTAESIDDVIAWPTLGGLTPAELSQLVDATGPGLVEVVQALQQARASERAGPGEPGRPRAAREGAAG